MSTSKKEEYNVVVLSRYSEFKHPSLGVKEEWLVITYVAAGLAPHPIEMIKKDWTLEKEKALIRKNIEERLKQKPEAYKV